MGGFLILGSSGASSRLVISNGGGPREPQRYFRIRTR